MIIIAVCAGHATLKVVLWVVQGTEEPGMLGTSELYSDR